MHYPRWCRRARKPSYSRLAFSEPLRGVKRGEALCGESRSNPKNCFLTRVNGRERSDQ